MCNSRPATSGIVSMAADRRASPERASLTGSTPADLEEFIDDSNEFIWNLEEKRPGIVPNRHQAGQ
jgi:hypothetical protein